MLVVINYAPNTGSQDLCKMITGAHLELLFFFFLSFVNNRRHRKERQVYTNIGEFLYTDSIVLVHRNNFHIYKLKIFTCICEQNAHTLEPVCLCLNMVGCMIQFLQSILKYLPLFSITVSSGSLTYVIVNRLLTKVH